MRIITQERKHILLLVFLGFLLSSFSSTIFFTFLHTPFAFQDFIYIPVFYKLYKDKYFIIKRFKYQNSIYLWLFLTILGVLVNPHAIGGVLGVSRNFLWILLFYYVGKNIIIDTKLLKALLIISLTSTICWCFDSYFGVHSMNYEDSSGAINGNMIAIIFVFTTVFFYSNNMWLICISLISNVYLCANSGLRRQIAVSFLSFTIAYILSTIKDKNFKKIVLGVVIVFSFSAAFLMLKSYLEEINPLLYTRVFTRTEMSLSGDMGASDTSRHENLTYIFDNFFDLILPHGFPSSRSEDGGGKLIDIPTYTLSYIFGVFPAIFFIIYLIKFSISRVFRYLKSANPITGIRATLCIVFFFLHFIEGSMYLFVYTVPFTGLTLGLIFRKDLE